MASLNTAVGAAQLPLTAEAVGDARVFPDPAKLLLLGLFRQALISELTAGWEAVVLDTPLYGQAVVADAYPEEPTEELFKQRKPEFPGLYVDRSGDPITEQFTFSLELVRQQWRFYYLIGQLDAAMTRKFSALLKVHVPHVVRSVLKAGRHPDYSSGARIIGAGRSGGLESARLKDQKPFVIGDDTPSASLRGVALSFDTIELVTKRRVNPVPEAGAIMQLDLAAPNTETLENFVEANTNYPPPAELP